jgi:hypothetical protein
MYKVGVKDSAVVKLDKKNKGKEFIKMLTLSHCTIEKDADGGGFHYQSYCLMISCSSALQTRFLDTDKRKRRQWLS